MKNSYKNFIVLWNKNENKIKPKIKESLFHVPTTDMVFFYCRPNLQTNLL